MKVKGGKFCPECGKETTLQRGEGYYWPNEKSGEIEWVVENRNRGRRAGDTARYLCVNTGCKQGCGNITHHKGLRFVDNSKCVCNCGHIERGIYTTPGVE